jgi:M6 family metalloprotease-like protein
LFTVAIPSSASPKAGSACTKVGSTSVAASKKYTCIKIKNKKVWINDTTKASVPKTALTNNSELLSIDKCKLQTADPKQRHFASGFPIYPERMNLRNSPTVQVLAVDFPDVKGNNPKKDLQDVTKYISKYFDAMSTESVSIDWRVPTSYMRMPKNVMDYRLNANFFDDKVNVGEVIDKHYWPYVRQVIAAYDPIVDFTGVETIIVAGPPAIKNSQIGMFIAQASEPSQGFSTSEGPIYNVLIRGNDESRNLLNWTHEFTHMLGLTDTRNTQSRQNQLNDGLGQFDLMSGEGAIELLAWHRFMLGILEDNQIHCTDSAISTHLIKPVESKTKEVKGVVIPLSATTGIAIESRRSIGYDTWLGKGNEGVLVMSIDTKIGYGYSPFKMQIGANTSDLNNYRDGLLRLGESVTLSGYKISYIEKGSFGDVIEVEKLQ